MNRCSFENEGFAMWQDGFVMRRIRKEALKTGGLRMEPQALTELRAVIWRKSVVLEF